MKKKNNARRFVQKKMKKMGVLRVRKATKYPEEGHRKRTSIIEEGYY
jgi:hypothetical protein